MIGRSLLGPLTCLAACGYQSGAPAAAAPDTAAVHAELNALADQYEIALKAGDAGAIAGHFTDDARVEFQRFPSAVGRPAIQAQHVERFAAQKVLEIEINTQAVSAPAADRASGRGTAVQTVEMGGKRSQEWWRWVAGYRKAGEGPWQLTFLMGFMDSTRAAQ